MRFDATRTDIGVSDTAAATRFFGSARHHASDGRISTEGPRSGEELPNGCVEHMSLGHRDESAPNLAVDGGGQAAGLAFADWPNVAPHAATTYRSGSASNASAQPGPQKQ